MKRTFVVVLAALMLLLPPFSGVMNAAPTAQGNACQFFTETGGGEGGFSVCDDAEANFLTTFNTYGLQRIGYPISTRYERDGFVTQAFQKAILQWRAESNSVAFVNTFDDLHNDGFDEQLLRVRQTPNQLPADWDEEGATFEEITAARQALLDERPALRTAYFSVSDPILFYGLPTSEVEDMGNHYAIRLQRAVLQEWKEEVPWASAGEVTVANGGDIAKELGALPAEALVPEAAPEGDIPAATPEPEETPAPEPTPEATPEATPEPTPEATPAPSGDVGAVTLIHPGPGHNCFSLEGCNFEWSYDGELAPNQYYQVQMFFPGESEGRGIHAPTKETTLAGGQFIFQLFQDRCDVNQFCRLEWAVVILEWDGENPSQVGPTLSISEKRPIIL
jgi:hypothetical protein